jgi:hypothetical protein
VLLPRQYFIIRKYYFIKEIYFAFLSRFENLFAFRFTKTESDCRSRPYNHMHETNCHFDKINDGIKGQKAAGFANGNTTLRRRFSV